MLSHGCSVETADAGRVPGAAGVCVGAVIGRVVLTIRVEEGCETIYVVLSLVNWLCGEV